MSTYQRRARQARSQALSPDREVPRPVRQASGQPGLIPRPAQSKEYKTQSAQKGVREAVPTRKENYGERYRDMKYQNGPAPFVSKGKRSSERGTRRSTTK